MGRRAFGSAPTRMIRRTWSQDKWMLTAQSEHGRLTGIIANAWSFHGERPSDEALRAILSHDDGWKPADESPRVNKAGQPMDFSEYDVIAQLEAWARCSAIQAEEGRFYGARLVAAHFAHMAETTIPLQKLSARGAVTLGNYIAGQRKSMEAWSKEAEKRADRGIGAKDALLFIAPDAAADDAARFKRCLRFLQVCEQISMMVCSDFTGEAEIADVPYMEHGDKLTVRRKGDNLAMTFSPLPLKVKLRDHLASWLIPNRAYADDLDLRQTLSVTKPTINEIHLGAG